MSGFSRTKSRPFDEVCDDQPVGGILTTEDDGPDQPEPLLHGWRNAASRRPFSAASRARGSWRARIPKNKGAILVLLISMAVDSGLSSALNQILFRILQSRIQNTTAVTYLIFLTFGAAVPQLLYPLAGWIADARIGRYRLIRISLWCMWLGQILLSVIFVPYIMLLPRAGYSAIALGFLFAATFVIVNVGLAGFQANAMQFGIDQMVESSGDDVSRFIHWYYWSTFFGGATLSVFLAPILSGYALSTLVAGINVLLMSCSLLAWYKLKHWLIIEPQGENPFRTVYNVIRFSLKHKRPVYRSALTYWDDRPLATLDVGKSKYGGPFTNEEVEDVKAFKAVVSILASLGLYLITNNSLGTPLINQMKTVTLVKISDKSYTDGDLMRNMLGGGLMLVLIPVYNLVIQPLVNNYICQLTILRKIGIGIVVGIVSQTMFLILYEITFNHTHDNNYCFLVNTTPAINSSISASYVAIPFTFSTIAELIVYIAGYEFICAQSPYRFRGMLIGTFYALDGLCYFIVSLFAVALVNGHSSRVWGNVGCGGVYYSAMLAMAIAGFILYLLAGKAYSMRERDDHIDHHMIAENYYSNSFTDNRSRS